MYIVFFSEKSFCEESINTRANLNREDTFSINFLTVIWNMLLKCYNVTPLKLSLTPLSNEAVLVVLQFSITIDIC